jgi:hypothetical protein
MGRNFEPKAPLGLCQAIIALMPPRHATYMENHLEEVRS